jgi:hypothetical protein
MENNHIEISTQDMSHIKGWGIDADIKNDPTYPMRQRGEHEHVDHWTRPTQQEEAIEVLHSNERPDISSVFGTSVPPSGLSGMIRRFAFRYSEGSFGHWLPLLLADRVNMVEGIVDDVAHGHIPNIYAEKGIKAEWQYNQKAAVRRVAIGALLVTAAVVLIARRRK